MKNSLWSFGCSFTAEYHPLDNNPPNNYDRYREYRGGNLPPVWPTLLSNKLNLENKNKGIGASSNYSIFYEFCKWCSKFRSGDYVIIGWTDYLRYLIAGEHHLQTILPNQVYPEFNSTFLDYMFVNRTNTHWIQELLRYTQIMNELCIEKNVKIFYWSYTSEIIEYIINNYQDCDMHQFINGDSKIGTRNIVSKMASDVLTITDETNNTIVDAHLGQIGHECQATYFYSEIIKNIPYINKKSYKII